MVADGTSDFLLKARPCCLRTTPLDRGNG